MTAPKKLKGVILAGGLGTRLFPLTKITNKHLLPVYDRPMIHYPIEALTQAGVDEIMIVTGGSFAGDFLQLLGNGKEFGLRGLRYAYQEGEGGIADALKLAEHFVDREPFAVVLGDNIVRDPLAPFVQSFLHDQGGRGARLLLKRVPDPERFGVAELKDGRIVSIVEKPAHPKSDLAVTGIYFYDAQVWDILPTLVASGRGELEITDVNNHYVQAGQCGFDVLEGWWTDAGTFESLHRASGLVRELRQATAAGIVAAPRKPSEF
jgi:glucose-1-phosphate thymidylyltransferase